MADNRRTRRERLLAGMWAVIAIVLWNGIYDLMLGRAIKDYMFRSALHEAGRGPRMTIAAVLDAALIDAVWVSTLLASIVLLAGMLTIRLSRPGRAG